MAKFSTQVRFSEHFGVDPTTLAKLGVFDPILNVDSEVFIDPLLLVDSQHLEISRDAQAHYERYFEQVAELLAATNERNDVPWRNAERLLTFPEVKWTCLGYGASSDSGSGSGAFTRAEVMNTAHAIVQLGVKNPDLFVALALLEKDIGPDRISDMVTNIILPELVNYNIRVLAQIPVPRERFDVALPNGTQIRAELPVNPFHKKRAPVILVPADILRDLPIAADWADVATAAQANMALRARVNEQIAKIWARKSKQDKDDLKRWALSSRHACEIFLDMLRGANPKPYDFVADPLGEFIWLNRIKEFMETDPLRLPAPPVKNVAELDRVVKSIIDHFIFLIEKRRLSEDFYYKDKVRPEKAAQRLFYAVAFTTCKANNVDITPEAETGAGPVDFKFSSGSDAKIIVEIKLSVNTQLIKGYTKQLAAYMEAEQSQRSYYLVIDVGGMGEKAEKLIALKNEAVRGGNRAAEIVFVDGRRKPSASHLP